MKKVYVNPTYQDIVDGIVDRTNMYPNIRIKRIELFSKDKKGTVYNCWLKNIKKEKILVSTDTRPKGVLNIKDIQEIEFY